MENYIEIMWHTYFLQQIVTSATQHKCDTNLSPLKMQKCNNKIMFLCLQERQHSACTKFKETLPRNTRKWDKIYILSEKVKQLTQNEKLGASLEGKNVLYTRWRGERALRGKSWEQEWKRRTREQCTDLQTSTHLTLERLKDYKQLVSM